MARILITGGGGGIARAMIKHLTSHNPETHEIIAFDLNEDVLEELEETYGIETYQGDITDEERVEEVIDAVYPFDVLVNAAGIEKHGATIDMPQDVQELIMNVNFWGPKHASDTAIRKFHEHDHSGRVVNITSLAAEITAPFLGMYSASKSALGHWTESKRLEENMIDSGIEMVQVIPDAVKTGLNVSGASYVEELMEGSRYAEGYEQRIKDRDYGYISAEKAGKILAKAATTNRPKAQYRIGWQTKVGPRFFPLTPRFLRDKLIGPKPFHYKIRDFFKNLVPF